MINFIQGWIAKLLRFQEGGAVTADRAHELARKGSPNAVLAELSPGSGFEADCTSRQQALRRAKSMLSQDVAAINTKGNSMTQVNKTTALHIALAMCTNEPCRICGLNITPEDLGDLVFAGYSSCSKSRSAHSSCWQKFKDNKEVWSYPKDADNP